MSNSVNICSIVDEAKKAIQDFRFRKDDNTAALILKVDREKQEIVIDEIIEDITIEDLQEALPSHQPRYVVLSYKRSHDDGRISFPLCFIFYTPRDSHAELQMMYAGSKMSVQRDFQLTRAYEIRELEELTEEWLLEISKHSVPLFNDLTVVRKYTALRPHNTDHERFFVGYKNGKCTRHLVLTRLVACQETSLLLVINCFITLSGISDPYPTELDNKLHYATQINDITGSYPSRRRYIK